MPTPLEKVDHLTRQIRFLEKLQQLNDLLSEIRERIGGTKDIETWLKEEGTGTMLDNLKGLLLSLQSDMVSIPKFITKLDAGISAAGQITAGVDAITRMVKAIQDAENSTGAQKVKDFAELFSDWTTLLGAIGYILEGFSLNPIIGVYFMLLGKAISAIATSLGVLEAAKKAQAEAIRIARGFDPKAAKAAAKEAEQKRQLQALIDDLKRQRQALIDEFDLKAYAQVDAVIAATLASMNITLLALDRLKTPLAAARGDLVAAWHHLQELIQRKGAILASGGSASEAEKLNSPIEEAEQALAKAYETYNKRLRPVKGYVDAIRRKLGSVQVRGEAVFDEGFLEDHYIWVARPSYYTFPLLDEIKRYLRGNRLISALRLPIFDRLGLTSVMGVIPGGGCYILAALLAGLGILSMCIVSAYFMITTGFFGLLGGRDEIAVQPDVPLVSDEAEGEATMSPREAFDLIDEIAWWYGLSDEEWWMLHDAYNQDPTGRLLYSIDNILAGLEVMQANINRWFAQPFQFPQVWLDIKMNFTEFPCNEEVNGVLTVCSPTADNLEAGEFLVFGMELEGEIPLDDPDLFYVYSVVLDTDGDPGNNYQFMPPYNWDYYQNTDTWYELTWDPYRSVWELALRDVRQGQALARHTDARVMISENLIYFVIPAAELETARPGYRMTSFAHDGTYAPEASGGDVTGIDPTEPLQQIPDEVIVITE
jgi:hypothetical protein